MACTTDLESLSLIYEPLLLHNHQNRTIYEIYMDLAQA